MDTLTVWSRSHASVVLSGTELFGYMLWSIS